jgi:hypothetical protein
MSAGGADGAAPIGGASAGGASAGGASSFLSGKALAKVSAFTNDASTVASNESMSLSVNFIAASFQRVIER